MEILPNESDAEEALQDIFMEIWNRAANFDARKGKALGWIICMARRRAIDHYRKIRRRADASEKLRLENDEGQGALGASFLGTAGGDRGRAARTCAVFGAHHRAACRPNRGG